MPLLQSMHSCVMLPDEAFVAAVHFAATIGALKMACLHMLHARSTYNTYIFAVLLRSTTYEHYIKTGNL